MLRRVGETIDPKDAMVKIKDASSQLRLLQNLNIILQCTGTGISYTQECNFQNPFRSMSVQITVCEVSSSLQRK